MKLEEFCSRFRLFLEKNPQTSELLEEGQGLMGELVADSRWFGGLWGKWASDPSFWEMQRPSIFPNEMTLHRSPDRAFSVLAYLWEPGTKTPVHDHGAWGIIGCLFDRVREIKFRRLDEGGKEGFAELEEASSRVIEGGGTTAVLPLDEGIHRMEASDHLTVLVNVYGPSIRRGYVQCFFPLQKKVIRAYSPRFSGGNRPFQAFRAVSPVQVKGLLKRLYPQIGFE